MIRSTRVWILILSLSTLFGLLNAQEKFDDYERHIFSHDGVSLPYRLLHPVEDTPNLQDYPLIVFLHGSGERGTDNESQLKHGGEVFLETINRSKYPAYVVFPQCPTTDYWAQVKVNRSNTTLDLGFMPQQGPTPALEAIMNLIDNLKATLPIDEKKIYVMGLSMGGMGTYELLARRPNTFAAAIPICGGGAASTAWTYAQNTPVWIVHGSKDNVVLPQESLKMASAIIRAGGYPKITFYEDARHDSWINLFEDSDLLPWLWKHSK